MNNSSIPALNLGTVYPKLHGQKQLCEGGFSRSYCVYVEMTEYTWLSMASCTCLLKSERSDSVTFDNAICHMRIRSAVQ